MNFKQRIAHYVRRLQAMRLPTTDTVLSALRGRTSVSIVIELFKS